MAVLSRISNIVTLLKQHVIGKRYYRCWKVLAAWWLYNHSASLLFASLLCLHLYLMIVDQDVATFQLCWLCCMLPIVKSFCFQLLSGAVDQAQKVLCATFSWSTKPANPVAWCSLTVLGIWALWQRRLMIPLVFSKTPHFASGSSHPLPTLTVLDWFSYFSLRL